MAENYFYSSLTGQQIEDRLVGGVVFNYVQDLTTSQKARARENIGAGEGSTSFKIMGYFATLNDLQEYLQTLPEPGDAYGISETPTAASEYLSPDGAQEDFTLSESPYALKITYVPTMTVLVRNTDYTYANGVVTFPSAPAAGTDTYLVEWDDPTAPYFVYVWDGVTNTWINNGTLFSDSLIDDNDITAETTWSSQKISTELSGKQDTLGSGDISTAMLADGAVTWVKLANDALFSPWKYVDTTNYSIVADDLGKTIRIQPLSTARTITLPQAVAVALPAGAEIGFLLSSTNAGNNPVTVDLSNVDLSKGCVDGEAKEFSKFKIVNGYDMVVIKKLWNTATGGSWLVQGNVEVVT